MNHLERTRQAVDQLNGQLTDLMDLAGVPDGSPTERAATRAMSEVYDVLDNIPRQGRTANFVFEEGPMIYVNPKKDIRDWQTSHGKKACNTSPRTAALSKTKSVTAKGPILSRRVITASLYEAMVEEALVSEEHELVPA